MLAGKDAELHNKHGNKLVCTGERNNTNSSQWGQEIAPGPQHIQKDTGSPAGDWSH